MKNSLSKNPFTPLLPRGLKTIPKFKDALVTSKNFKEK
jgi:hypothetical protein